MNRHYRNGFQRTVTNDVYHVEERLKEIDEHLYVMWHPGTGEHLIVDGLVELAVMRIPQPGFPSLDGSVVAHIKRIDTRRGFSAIQHVEASDAARERESERRTNEIGENFARDTIKAARQLAYYG